jgi:hypothetical protein
LTTWKFVTTWPLRASSTQPVPVASWPLARATMRTVTAGRRGRSRDVDAVVVVAAEHAGEREAAGDQREGERAGRERGRAADAAALADRRELVVGVGPSEPSASARSGSRSGVVVGRRLRADAELDVADRRCAGPA